MPRSKSSFSPTPRQWCPSVIGYVVLVVGIGEWACRERTLQVLTPATSGAVASNAPPEGAGAPNAAAGAANPVAGSGPGVSSAECPTGVGLGEDCISSNDCCSAYCGPTPTGRLVCLPSVGCWGVGIACEEANDCCSLACVATDNGNACGDFGYCGAKSGACETDTDCCSSICEGGLCKESSPPACLPAGELCAGAAECCSSVCALAGDGRTRCQLLVACRVVGEICAAAGDCCSGVCQNGASGVSRCGPAKACIAGDAKPCSRQVGDLCKTEDECCSRVCADQADGSARCASASGCRQACEICQRGTDCCSGSCVAGAEGLLRCAMGGCANEGDACSKNDDCCQIEASFKCVEEPAGQKLKRCERDLAVTPCIATAEPCALGSRCCSGICAPDESWQFRCATDFVAQDRPCSTRTDCGYLNADCVSLLGERRCYVTSIP
jgi:hypothetical protein